MLNIRIGTISTIDMTDTTIIEIELLTVSTLLAIDIIQHDINHITSKSKKSKT